MVKVMMIILLIKMYKCKKINKKHSTDKKIKVADDKVSKVLVEQPQFYL